MSDHVSAPQGLAGPHGGDLLVALMDELGVDTAFGVVSVHNLPLIDAVSRRRRFVAVRHEASAVNAADGWGRVAGRPGIAITSTGTGAGNAAGSLVESLAAGSQVLHLTGQIEGRYLGQGRGFIHETRDQRGMLDAISKRAFTVADVDSALETLREAAIATLAAPHGPVSIEWPIDLQYAVHAFDHDSAFDLVLPGRPAAVATDLDRAATLLAGARRPMIWLGGGATSAGVQVEELVDRTRAGVVTSNSGRGTIDEGHGACIGNFATSPAVRRVLSESDLLLAVGTHFRSNETDDYALDLPATIVQVDLDPAAVGRVYPVEVGVVGDAGEILQGIIDRLPERTLAEHTWPTAVSAARREARQGLSAAIGWQSGICDAVRTALPRRAVVARDVTIPSSTWGNRLLGLAEAAVNVFPKGGGIGQGLGMGIGAALARPDVPTLVLAGDGGLAVHLGELGTLAQERPWLTLLLYNDGGYGVLRNTQDVFFGTRSGVDLATPDFALLSAAYGIPHHRVGGLDDIEGALADALATRGPAVVEVDVDAFGPMPKPFTPPVRIPVAEVVA